MGLVLASRIADRATAEAIQLAVEYDPQPPFDSGSMQKASKPIRRQARRMLVMQYLKEKGRGVMRMLAQQ
jgi:hypothetical protein